VLGVVKAYTTRVGNGPLPTEFEEPLQSEVRKLGNEYGATTGASAPLRLVRRARREVRDAREWAVRSRRDEARRAGHLDRWRLRGLRDRRRRARGFPGDLSKLDCVTPKYEWFDGWKRSTRRARARCRPAERGARVSRPDRELVEAPITYVSVGRAATRSSGCSR
jgi:adenylosuccinate synthase